ncbi:MAG: DUF7210 family protein [Gammaproteobacteria bacterium]
MTTGTNNGQRETVALVMPHIHGGEQKKPGDEIEVTAKQKQWLMQRGIVQPEQTSIGE